MQIDMLHAKIQNLRLTDKNLAYVGSITVDQDLLDAVGLIEHQKVLVCNKNNGQRLETYLFLGERGQGDCILNGAAARLAEVGDEMIIISFCALSREEALKWRPKVIFCDAENRILEPAPV